jgi:diacylglycerol kinase family enzyme
MNINELNKQHKISLLKALATGKITKHELSHLKKLDTLFVEHEHEPYKFKIDGEYIAKYSIAGVKVDEQEFRKRLEFSKLILGEAVVHIVIVHKSKNMQSNDA